MALEMFVLDRGVDPPTPVRRRRRDIDWNAIECDYRTASMSLRELAAKHGCSHSAIANFAGRHGWTRNRASPSSVGDREPQHTGESTCFISNMD